VSRVTNRVGLEALSRLLTAARRGVLAHVDPGGAVQALPVALRWRDGRFRVGLPPGTVPDGARVALAVDDGWFWWDLEAVLARGVLAAAEGPGAGAPPGLAWFELRADRLTAWDYGALREEP
jgi:hypothetical protein